MGQDKAWLEIGGRAIVERVIAALAPVTPGVAIIANNSEYARLGLPVFADSNIGVGPLEAIRTALANSPTPRVILAGCDLPFVTSELFGFLLGVAGEIQAVVPVGADGKLEPLCAVYATSALEAVTKLIENGERMVRVLFEHIPTRLVPFAEIQHLRGAEFFFENVNTPQEYENALRIFERLQAG
jgi:molybdopterin-guanine dinucleotide biosynthesis protein A